MKDSRLIHLNSLDATQSQNHYRFHFQPIVPVKHLEMQAGLISALLPSSYYSVNSTNNTFTLDGTQYQVPPGNYSATDLVSTLDAMLPCSVAYSRVTNTLTLTSVSSMTISATRLLGFSQQTSGTSLVSDMAIDLSGTKSIMIRVLNFTDRSISSFSKSTTTTIARVPTNCERNGVMYYFQDRPIWQTLPHKALGHLEVECVDDFGNTIDFRGVPFSFTLEVRAVPMVQDQPVETHREIVNRMIEDASQRDSKPKGA